MEIKKIKSIIESVLFASGRVVETKEFMTIFELSYPDIDAIIQDMRLDFESEERGLEIIKVDDGYQLCTKKEHYEYIQNLLDTRNAPSLSRSNNGGS